MNISINKPCHEDWSKMTPNEQGAFCGICTKNVIDFSVKSLEEIKDYFSKPKPGKLCGRFTEDQLVELNMESFIDRFFRFKLSRKLATITAMALVLFFGLPKSSEAQDDKHIKMGKIKAPTTHTTTTVKNPEIKTDTIKGTNQPEKHLKGDVMLEPKNQITPPKVMGGVGRRPNH